VGISVGGGHCGRKQGTRAAQGRPAEHERHALPNDGRKITVETRNGGSQPPGGCAHTRPRRCRSTGCWHPRPPMARDGALSKWGVGSCSPAAWSAREIELQALHTVCRSFPKISSALNAKVCGGSTPFRPNPFSTPASQSNHPRNNKC
jgi:hypothetical protein